MLRKCAVLLTIVTVAGLTACNRGEPAGESRPRVALVVKCIADVKGSPFDPSAEVAVTLGT